MYITYNLLFYLYHVYMIDGVTRPGGLLGLLVRVKLSSGVTICNVKVSRWGNPPNLDRVHVTKKLNERNNSETNGGPQRKCHKHTHTHAHTHTHTYIYIIFFSFLYRAIKSKYGAINGNYLARNGTIVKSHVIRCQARCFSGREGLSSMSHRRNTGVLKHFTFPCRPTQS